MPVGTGAGPPRARASACEAITISTGMRSERETAARIDSASASAVAPPARGKDESQKVAAVGGALLLGHQSSHQRPVRLTIPSGR